VSRLGTAVTVVADWLMQSSNTADRRAKASRYGLVGFAYP
jgi:hypothetical protein